MKHPLIKPETVEQRLYQLNLAGKALEGSSLVVLPTGLGKTIIALFVIVSRLQRFGGKALILSPTKPLVDQHAAFFKKVMTLPEEEILAFTGSIAPAEREKLWARGKLIVSTPQVIENDLLTKRISLEDVSHITFDEAHRAVGNYAYTFIAEKYFESAKNPHVLGITASPGSSDEKIAEVCQALHVENVAVKTEKDRDVRPYVQEKEIEWLQVLLPAEMAEIRGYLEKIFDDRLKTIRELGFSAGSGKYISKKDLLLLQKQLQGEIRIGGDPAIFSAMSVVAEMMKVNHAVEMVETQGLETLRKYLEKLEAEASSSSASKAAKRLMDDLYMRKALYRVKECDVEHPKLELSRKIVSEQLEENPDSRVIVFTNYRDTAEIVANALSKAPGIVPIRFVGQGSRHKDKGLTQKQQVEILEKFRAGEYNALVATSVAEEGLDIPSTDMVLFYEPIPSEIRSIQRKGRTGRQQKGRVIVLVTKGTRDEAYYWSSKNKEKRMLNSMHGLETIFTPKASKKSAELSDFESRSCTSDSKLKIEEIEMENEDEDENGINISSENLRKNAKERQQTLVDFEALCGKKSENKSEISGKEPETEPLRIVIDHRETKCGVAKTLDRLGMELSFAALEIGDYVVSDRLAVERKRTDDFASSLIDGKRNLFAQLSDLARVYEKPVLIIEGEDLFTSRQINPNAIYGSLVSITIDFGVSILNSRDEAETASILKLLAKKEQTENKNEINPHGKKSASTLAEQQEYLISSISNIGPKAARNLLLHFGSVEAIMRANIEELKKVKLIGPKTAAKIREILESSYKG
ncbi:ATP-dependent RNA helicase, EIF-4A family [Methanosarcina sp. WWM596]|nr:ATP-dependent RNA helicase, EIF-4A family [Methanosarcina sp. WWM596]AKB23397.1 ATP-dependent RNA helicase, EIF-4A family [Methanosarcina sp. WH1]